MILKIRIVATIALILVTFPGAQSQESPPPESEAETRQEGGLYYMKGRFYDPETGRFLGPDPVEGDTRVPGTLHRYLYALNNPLVYIDPDGRRVRALDDLALERIRSTLPPKLQSAVIAGEGGLLKREPINAVETDDLNFLALRELVNHADVVAVDTAPAIEYLDAQENRRRKEFLYETPEKIRADLIKQGLSKEDAENLIGPEEFNVALGVFLTPRDDTANTNPHDDRQDRSLTNEATAVVPDNSIPGIPEVEHAMTTAHELYGHGLLYQQGKEFTHPPVPNSVFGEIQERTRKTFNSGIVGEDQDSPGAQVVSPHGKNQSSSDDP